MDDIVLLIGLMFDLVFLVLVVYGLITVIRMPASMRAIAASSADTNRQVAQMLILLREASTKTNNVLGEIAKISERTEGGAEELRESNVMAVQALLDVRDSLQEIGSGA